ncbi:MAG: hypothetical protein AAF483_01200 [Planctomycetota bacterium]
MFRSLSHIVACLALMTIFLAVGCQQAEVPDVDETSATTLPPQSAAQGGHHHGLGPNGGHMLHLAPSGVHAEWAQDEEDQRLFTVYLDDFDEDKIVSAKFVVGTGEERDVYNLVKGNSGWSISSEEMLAHFSSDDGAKVKLVVTDDEGEHSCQISKDSSSTH